MAILRIPCLEVYTFSESQPPPSFHFHGAAFDRQEARAFDENIMP